MISETNKMTNNFFGFRWKGWFDVFEVDFLPEVEPKHDTDINRDPNKLGEGNATNAVIVKVIQKEANIL